MNRSYVYLLSIAHIHHHLRTYTQRQRWMREGIVYRIPRGQLDDLYWMYATVAPRYVVSQWVDLRNVCCV